VKTARSLLAPAIARKHILQQDPRPAWSGRLRRAQSVPLAWPDKRCRKAHELQVRRDRLCFGALQSSSNESFFAASPLLADPTSLRKIRSDLPIYLFSGSEDPVGQQLEGVRILIERYRAAGIRDISHDFYPGGRHEMLNETNRAEVRPIFFNGYPRCCSAAFRRMLASPRKLC
jgi:alpha-beta hydrolase superfamily lysophospholipase